MDQGKCRYLTCLSRQFGNAVKSILQCWKCQLTVGFQMSEDVLWWQQKVCADDGPDSLFQNEVKYFIENLA